MNLINNNYQNAHPLHQQSNMRLPQQQRGTAATATATASTPLLAILPGAEISASSSSSATSENNVVQEAAAAAMAAIPAQPIATATTGAAYAEVDPQYILNELKLLKKVEHTGRNNKFFFASYNKFVALTTDQKNKMRAYFVNLEPAIQQAVNVRAEAAAVRDNVQETRMSAQTNKNDRARLLHVFTDPLAYTMWRAAFTPLNRLELDEGAADASIQKFDNLAVFFQ